MAQGRSFPEHAERVLIVIMVTGIALITQRFSLGVFQWGLSMLVVATLLQIAVGNLAKDASFGRSIVLILVILGVVAAVFTIGIWVVPLLAKLGR